VDKESVARLGKQIESITTGAEGIWETLDCGYRFLTGLFFLKTAEDYLQAWYSNPGPSQSQAPIAFNKFLAIFLAIGIYIHIYRKRHTARLSAPRVRKNSRHDKQTPHGHELTSTNKR